MPTLGALARRYMALPSTAPAASDVGDTRCMCPVFAAGDDAVFERCSFGEVWFFSKRLSTPARIFTSCTAKRSSTASRMTAV